MWGNTVAKQKPCKGNTVVIHSFFLKKSYKSNLLTSSIYKKKTDKGYLKKKSQFWVKEMKKNVQKKK
jgi:hypothetical protein